MAPVLSPGVDQAINETGQLIATILTFGLALGVIAVVVRQWRRTRAWWPFVVLLSGMVTCLLEPLYDHLYGLWFATDGQWTLFSTYGVSLPVWLPAIYLAYYGGGTLYVANLLRKGAGPSAVMRFYALNVAFAIVAEIAYIQAFASYDYQDTQPFVVAGYPIFLAFVNSVSPVLAGVLVFRALPFLHGLWRLALVMFVPLCFAMDAFGGGFLYLAVRHSGEDPSFVLVHLAALTCVAAAICSLRLAMLGMETKGDDTQSTPAEPVRTEARATSLV